MKALLLRHLKDTGDASRATILSELFVGGFSRRADIVLINGKLSAFEIKGELDDLTRLPGQIVAFLEYFESVTIVCAPKHTEKVLEIADNNIGVWEISNESLIRLREPTLSPKADRRVWLSHLPVKEIRSLLTKRKIPASRARRDKLICLAEPIPIADIRNAALEHLKKKRVKPWTNKNLKKIRNTSHPNDPPDSGRNMREYLELFAASEVPLNAIPRKRTKSDVTT